MIRRRPPKKRMSRKKKIAYGSIGLGAALGGAGVMYATRKVKTLPQGKVARGLGKAKEKFGEWLLTPSQNSRANNLKARFVLWHLGVK